MFAPLLTTLVRCTRPQPSLKLGRSAAPMSTVPLTSSALAMAGDGSAPPLKERHHSVTSATEPEMWGAAMLVPEQ